VLGVAKSSNGASSGNLRVYTNPSDQFPGEAQIDEELCHFVIAAGGPLPGNNRAPVQPIELTEVAEKIGRAARGVDVTEGPFAFCLDCPFDDLVHIRNEVDNWTLAFAVRDVGMVSSMDDVEHHGAWAEIERNIVADMRSRMTAYGQAQPVRLDLVVSDDGSSLPFCHHRIRPQPPIRDDRGEIVNVDDVVDSRLCGNRHNQSTKTALARALTSLTPSREGGGSPQGERGCPLVCGANRLERQGRSLASEFQ
jgi:hypothetical protein